MKPVAFRRQPKVSLNVWVPEKIAEDIREKSDASGRTIGAVITEILCHGMQRDPSEFGITSPEKPKSSAVA